MERRPHPSPHTGTCGGHPGHRRLPYRRTSVPSGRPLHQLRAPLPYGQRLLLLPGGKWRQRQWLQALFHRPLARWHWHHAVRAAVLGQRTHPSPHWSCTRTHSR